MQDILEYWLSASFAGLEQGCKLATEQTTSIQSLHQLLALVKGEQCETPSSFQEILTKKFNPKVTVKYIIGL